MLEVPVTSVARWEEREMRQEALVRKPGPQKALPPDPAALYRDMALLRYGIKRTQGAGDMTQKYRDSVSRREMAELLRRERAEKRLQLRRIAWHVPGSVFAIDGTELETGMTVQQMRDMASKYKFPPLAGTCGEEVAGYLSHCFHTYGAPLFLKRDNGSNLNHASVNEVLAEHSVIPVNSPRHYPPYNGGIEHDQGELKRALVRELQLSPEHPDKHMEAYVKNAVHELNHRERRSLGGKTSCRVFFDGKEERVFTIRERKSILEWLMERASRIMKNMQGASSRIIDAAWRVAVEQWLRIHGFITVRVNGKVLPNFALNLNHY
jgi:hypothetical protein